MIGDAVFSRQTVVSPAGYSCLAAWTRTSVTTLRSQKAAGDSTWVRRPARTTGMAVSVARLAWGVAGGAASLKAGSGTGVLGRAPGPPQGCVGAPSPGQ